MIFLYDTYGFFETFIWNFPKLSVLLDFSSLKYGGIGHKLEFWPKQNIFKISSTSIYHWLGMLVPCSVRVHVARYTLPHFNCWWPHRQSANAPLTILSQGKPSLSSQSLLIKQLSLMTSFELTVSTCPLTSVETPSGGDHCMPTLGLDLDPMPQSSLKLTPWSLPPWLLWFKTPLSLKLSEF